MKHIFAILFASAALMAQNQTPIFGGVTQTVVAPKYFDFVAMEQTGAGPVSFTAIFTWFTPTINDYNALNAQQTCQFWGNPSYKGLQVFNRPTATYTYWGTLPAPPGTAPTTSGMCTADLTKSYFEFGKCLVGPAAPPNYFSTVTNCTWGGSSMPPNNAVRMRLYLLDTGGVSTGYVLGQTSNGYSFARWF